jgi:acylphosphatase
MAMESLSIRIEGRVQGVGFRYWTVKLARSLFMNGWVRNMPDGSVKIQAQGDSVNMAAFIDDLENGPPGAMVRKIITEPSAVNENLKSFEIL